MHRLTVTAARKPRERGAAAGAGVDPSVALQRCQGRVVPVASMALVLDPTVPLESEEFESAQDAIRGPGDLAGPVQVLDA